MLHIGQVPYVRPGENFQPVNSLDGPDFSLVSVPLLKRRVPVVCDRTGDRATPLYYAAFYGRMDIARWVVGYVFSISAINTVTHTPYRGTPFRAAGSCAKTAVLLLRGALL